LIVAALCVALVAPSASEAKARFSGVVWTDQDRDGVRDPGDLGRGGVRVEILRMDKRDSSPTIIRSIQTSASGGWSSPIGPAGFYRARVLQPGSVEGFTPRDQGGSDRVDSDVVPAGPRIGMTPLVKSRAGKSPRRFDAGLLVARLPAPPETRLASLSDDISPGAGLTIGDFVWADANADGVQDPAEAGIGGIAIELWNPAKTTLLATTTTNSAGYWALPGNAGASYRVRVVEAGHSVSPKHAIPAADRDSDINSDGADAGFSDVFTPGASAVDVDAGLYLSIGDFVWDDANSNGLQDFGEPGIAGVQVQLWNATKTMLHATASTDASGRYRMVVPAAGDYRIRVLLPAGFTAFSAKGAGADAVDSDVNPSGPDAGFSDPFSLPGRPSPNLDAGVL
jgi:hypothetical protein